MSSKTGRKPALSAKLIAANQARIIEAGFAADSAQHQSDRKHGHGARAPPVRLLDKAEVRAITGVTFQTIWKWMQRGSFPRGRIVGGKTMWLSSDIESWIASLPPCLLKGNALDQTTKEPEPV
jgi:predicted DNA-binding transcriptional regulator AlpA